MGSTKIISSAIFILLNITAKSQHVIDTTVIINSIFPPGEKSTSNNNFNGGVSVKRGVSTNDSLYCVVGNI